MLLQKFYDNNSTYFVRKYLCHCIRVLVIDKAVDLSITITALLITSTASLSAGESY